MNELVILKEVQSQEYPIRLVAKAVIVDEKNNILLFNKYLPGGGIEKGETFEEALERECLEEVGAKIEVIKQLGVVTQYRDFIKKKYEIHGFFARLISIQKPTTTQKDELNQGAHFMSIFEAKHMLQERIKEMETSTILRESEGCQARYYNRITSLTFIEEVEKLLFQ